MRILRHDSPRFRSQLKSLTRSAEAAPEVAAIQTISAVEGLDRHGASAAIRTTSK